MSRLPGSVMLIITPAQAALLADLAAREARLFADRAKQDEALVRLGFDSGRRMRENGEISVTYDTLANSIARQSAYARDLA